MRKEMKWGYRIAMVIIVLPFLLSCTDNNFSALTDREKTIEVNGKKYPEGLFHLTGYWSDNVREGELTVSIDQDDRYEDTYETCYYTFHFYNPECPTDGDNLAKMNLKLEVDFSEQYCSYESGDLIVKSIFNKKKGQIKVRLENLKMSNKRKTKEYLFNGTVTVPFDYFIDDYLD
jgi:hypothetical protein